MIKASIKIQELRRKIYLKAKAEKSWRFWGLYVHLCKYETLREAYRLAKVNNGVPGVDNVTFNHIETYGTEKYLKEIREELLEGTYRPLRNRKQPIPKGDGNKMRLLSIPCIRDRIVQGALKLILEPIFEADFQEGSFGYRPKRTAHEAVHRVSDAIIRKHYRVIDMDLKSYFDSIQHAKLLGKFAERIDDDKVMHLIKLVLKTSGKKGVPQGGPFSPLASNIYLNSVDEMLEKAKETTRTGKFTHIEYARWADDLVILVDVYRKWDWLYQGVIKRLKEELDKLGVSINLEKTKGMNLEFETKFTFLGFDFCRRKTKNGKWGVSYSPSMKVRTRLLRKLKVVFRRFHSQPVQRVIELINPILRGWVNYFRVGQSSKCFGYVKDWVMKKIRRHLMKQRKLKGFGWEKWSRYLLYDKLNLYSDYQIIRYNPILKAKPA